MYLLYFVLLNTIFKIIIMHNKIIMMLSIILNSSIKQGTIFKCSDVNNS